MLRLFLISLPLAVLMLLPMYAAQHDFTFPGQVLLRIPATGLDYMAIFFHELGHTLTHWAFGEPAIPTFDFEEGGGMTYGMGRSWALQGAVWAGMALGIAWLWKNAGRGLFFAALGVCLFFFAASFSVKAREVLVAYMGHGGEMLVGCLCILRATTNTVEGAAALPPESYSRASRAAIERPLAMVFGLYDLGRNVLMCRSLYDALGLALYDAQKTHVLGDFRQLSELLNIPITSVAAGSIAITAVLAVLTVALALWLGRTDDNF